jgi:uncharacterized protein
MKDVILEGVEEFVANIDRGLDELKIDRNFLTEMDHICYRVETDERYRELVEKLGQWAVLLGEHMVSGRLIATFQLNEPLEVGDWRVSYLELPAPKEGSPYAEGLEHAEFVVLGGNLDRFRAQHAHLEDAFSTKGMSKELNPELGLKTAGISVKFHRLPLGEVVRLEKLLDES